MKRMFKVLLKTPNANNNLLTSISYLEIFELKHSETLLCLYVIFWDHWAFVVTRVECVSLNIDESPLHLLFLDDTCGMGVSKLLAVAYYLVEVAVFSWVEVAVFN